jgi:hypothetical protein
MGRGHLEELDVDGSVIKKQGAKVWTGMKWLRWWAFVNSVMKLRLPWTAEFFLTR